MTDQIHPGPDDDPLQVNSIIAEAAAVQQDVQAFQVEVETWQSEVEAWQSETETWQDETAEAQSNASAPSITPEQIEALKQRLSNAAVPKGKTTAAKKSPDPEA